MKFISDTHAVFWYLLDDAKLNTNCKKLFLEASSNEVLISMVSLMEMIYIFKKLKIKLTFEKLLQMIESDSKFDIVPLTLEMIREMLPLTMLDIHDAAIVATAKVMKSPLMTRDQKIIDLSLVPVIVC